MAKKIAGEVKISLKHDLPRMALHLMTPLQGDMKILEDSEYQKLKKRILAKGFSVPFFLWENPEDAQIYILDGHQRRETLLRMKAEGYKIPELPFIWIEAESLDEAKEQLLAITSQYGKINEVGLHNFLSSFKTDVAEIIKEVSIPVIDDSFIQNLGLSYGSVTDAPGLKVVTTPPKLEKAVKNTSREVDMDEMEDFEHECPKCGFCFDSE